MNQKQIAQQTDAGGMASRPKGQRWVRQPTRVQRLEQQIARLEMELKRLKGHTQQRGSRGTRNSKAGSPLLNNRFSPLTSPASPSVGTENMPMQQRTPPLRNEVAKDQRNVGKCDGQLKLLAKTTSKVAEKPRGIRKLSSRSTSQMKKVQFSDVSGLVTTAKVTSQTAALLPITEWCQNNVEIVGVEPSAGLPTPSTVTDATEKPHLRSSPKTAGQSYAKTLASNGGVRGNTPGQDELPIKSLDASVFVKPTHRPGHGIFGWRKVCGVSELKRRQTAPVRVDEELYGYLLYSFQFQERNVITLRAMASKAKQYLAGFDVSDATWLQLHNLSVNAVTMAMNVPSAEVKAFDRWASPQATKERLRHAELVTTGKAATPEQSLLGRLCNRAPAGGLAPKKP